MGETSLRRLGDLLDGMLPPSAPAASLGPVGRAWRDVVGPAVADAAWPARVLRDGTLVVHCASSVWASELPFLAPAILDKLRGAVGAPAPSALRFRVGPLPRPAVRPAARPASAAPSPGDRRRADELASAIADDELREAAAGAIAAALARARKSAFSL